MRTTLVVAKKLALLTVALVALAIMVSGCGGNKPTTTVTPVNASVDEWAPAERVILVGVDRSNSMPKVKLEEAQNIFFREMDSHRDIAFVKLYTFGNRKSGIERRWRGIPTSQASVWEVAEKYVMAGPPMSMWGTHFDPFLEQCVKDIAETGKPTYILLLTDGGCDDALDTKKQFRRLANQSNFRGMLIAPVITSVALDVEKLLPRDRKNATKADQRFVVTSSLESQTYIEKWRKMTE